MLNGALSSPPSERAHGECRAARDVLEEKSVGVDIEARAAIIRRNGKRWIGRRVTAPVVSLWHD